MKALILVSQKKKELGIITAVKWTILEITTTRKTTQSNMQNLNPHNKEF